MHQQPLTVMLPAESEFGRHTQKLRDGNLTKKTNTHEKSKKNVKYHVKSSVIQTIAIIIGVVQMIVAILYLMVVFMCYTKSTNMLEMLKADIAEQRDRNFIMDVIGIANVESINQLRFEDAKLLANSNVREIPTGLPMVYVMMHLTGCILFICTMVLRNSLLIKMYILVFTISVIAFIYMVIEILDNKLLISENWSIWQFGLMLVVWLGHVMNVLMFLIYRNALIREHSQNVKLNRPLIGKSNNGFMHTLHDAAPNYVV